MSSLKEYKRQKRHRKISKRIAIGSDRPRLIVYRSLTHIYASVFDNKTGKTILSTSDLSLKIKKGKKVEKATEVGKEIAKLALEKNVSEIAFDRNGYKYHGRVKALAEGAREGGLKF